MIYLDGKMDVVANNLANVNTNGFKRSGVAFNQHIVAEQAKHRDQIDIDPLPGGQIKTYVENTQGNMIHTGSPLNFALDGEGFFTIQTPHGIAYTRDGQFTHDDEGFITTMDGYYVVGEYNGPIRIFGKDFSVSDSGDILVDNYVVNRFLIENFDINDVVQRGHNLFFVKNWDDIEFIDPTAHVKQGYLENSNVSIVKEMIEMIAINRQYQANEKAVRTQDDALNKTVNNIAR
jgi:flagellar basal-body rod protein FlgG